MRLWLITLSSLVFLALATPGGEHLPPRPEPAELAILQDVPLRLPDSPHPSVPWSYFSPAWDPKGPVAEVFDAIRPLLHDPDDRLEPDLRVPDGLRDRVLFWSAIYSAYDSRTKVVHDRDNPALVYGVIDLRTIPPMAGKLAADIEKKVLAQLKERLSRPHLVSADERIRMKAYLSRFGSPNLLSIRTQTGQSDMFALALKRSRAMLPMIEAEFKSKGLPVGLSRIPFVESSFNHKARSRAGAMGLWQFTPPTAKEFIHKKNKKLWNDPFHQTTAAARLLKRYRAVLPDWGSAITAYNSGVARVGRLLRQHRVDSAEALVNADALGFAGENFLSEVLAANLLVSYRTHVFLPEVALIHREMGSSWLAVAGAPALPASRVVTIP